jgi:hypothetical protein
MEQTSIRQEAQKWLDGGIRGIFYYRVNKAIEKKKPET